MFFCNGKKDATATYLVTSTGPGMAGRPLMCILVTFFEIPSFTLTIMREVISVHVGQAGVQIGNACCELLSLLLFSLV